MSDPQQSSNLEDASHFSSTIDKSALTERVKLLPSAVVPRIVAGLRFVLAL